MSISTCLKLTLPDNGKRPHNSSSDEESEKLHASRRKKWRRKALVMESDTGDEDDRETDRSALKEAINSRKKKCQDQKAKGKGKAGHKGKLLYLCNKPVPCKE